LRVGEKLVAANFDRYGVPRENVSTIPGFFVNSMPPFRAALESRGERLAVLRMDGDMYDSTIDLLYNLYDRVTVGGYVIIDDFGWTSPRSFGARDAVIHFRALHGIEDDDHTITPDDDNGASFRKAREIVTRRDVYYRILNASTSRKEATALLIPQGLPGFFELRARWQARLDAADAARHERIMALPPGGAAPNARRRGGAG